MSGHRARALGCVAAGVLALGVLAWVLRRAAFGDVDPLSAAIGAGSLVAGVAALVVAVRTWRWQQTGIGDLTVRLADAVGRAEQQARQQLLGGHDRAIDVEFGFQPAPAHNAVGAPRRGRLGEVAAYYQRLRPRRLTITGAPGAGKTVLAIELALAMLESRAGDDPVPVRLSAAFWDIGAGEQVEPVAATQQMERWLVAHLVNTYRFSERSAQALVYAGRILPVIDGLDELDATDSPGYASRAGQALRVFNAYQRYRHKAELVVTCRSAQYAALTADNIWIEDAARVEIRPVDVAKAKAFITARVKDAARWHEVLTAIRRERRGPLACALNTPWRLTLAVVVYEQRDHDGAFLRHPSELTDPALDTPDVVGDHLLRLFLPAALGAMPSQPYDPDRVHRWLAVLAGYLNRNAATGCSLGGRALSGTDIVLHELWPLAGSRRPRIVNLALLAAIWVVAVPIMLTQVPIGLSLLELLGASMPALALSYSVYNVWFLVWPEPQRLNLGRLRTPEGRRQLMVGFALGLAPGLVVGLASGLGLGLAYRLTSGPAGLSVGLTYGLAVGLTYGLMAGLAYGFMEDAGTGTRDPRSIIDGDLTFGLTFGLAAGLSGGLAGWLMYGLAVGLTYGLALGLTGGFTAGTVGLRYVLLLLCTRKGSEHWLPWRLDRFLTHCCRAGLMRTAGSGYQFRHRELQDYLAHRPVP
ncbi:NACHT domain-containing protein [Micromonospora profundi]|uniref:NACHT domain-containing protein n=1 Tax=Micromonospora profundi TaxID=1420889 RepID=UPI003819965B